MDCFLFTPLEKISHDETDSQNSGAGQIGHASPVRHRSRGDPRHNLHFRSGAGKNHHFAVRRGESLHERFGRHQARTGTPSSTRRPAKSDTSSAIPSALPIQKASILALISPKMPGKKLVASLQVPSASPLQTTLTRAWVCSKKTRNT